MPQSGSELTIEIACMFLEDPDDVDLDEFTLVSDKAAEALAEHEGSLSLVGRAPLISSPAKRDIAARLRCRQYDAEWAICGIRRRRKSRSTWECGLE